MRVTIRKTFLCLYIILCFVLTLLNFFGRIPTITEEIDPHKHHSYSVQSHGLFSLFRRDDTTTNKSSPALFPEDSQETDRILEQLKHVPERLASRPVKIYLPQGLNGVPAGSEEFNNQNCPVKNCFITTEKDDEETADVVFYRNSLSPLINRMPKQIWVVQLLESPENTVVPNQAKKLFNYTATYRWDSDLVTPYERWTPMADVPLDQRLPSSSPKLSKKSNYAAGKSKLVAWFVSHCHTNNDRLGYARELSKHISVDIYGSCSNLSCNRQSADCWKQLDEHYKFYLSFENGNCQDYVTEKFFVNGLQYDVIPIVMGPPRSYYEKISPPHSFIHVNDFKSPKEMATYLHYLNKNDSAFNAYFAWKGSGQFINTKFWCRLCALVQKPRPKEVNNLETWWKSSNTCTSAQPWS